MYFIGVDNGAERTRTVVLNLESATLVAQSEKAHGHISGLPAGHCEQDPLEWIRSVDHTVRDCLSQLGEGRRRVAGIGVSGQGHGLVYLDKDNRVVRPAKLQDDRSAAHQCDELGRAFGGGPGLIELCGNPLHSNQSAPRILWLKQNEPYHFQRVATFLSPHDFVNYWLAGVKRTEFGEASESGLLDVRNRRWCRELCDFIDPRLGEMLPPVRSSCEPLGVLRPDLAREWELSDEVLVSAGSAADMMTVLGAGATSHGAVAIASEGAATLFGLSNRPLVDPRGELRACCDATDHWMPLLRCSAAAEGVRQVCRHYGWDAAHLDQCLEASEPGGQGLTFLPGVSGTTLFRRGALLGIDSHNFTAINVARAAMEALALALGRGLRRMRQLGFDPTDVRLTGDSADRPAWRQLLADVLGLPVLRSRPESSPALGAALQAGVTFFHRSGENLTYEEMTSYAALPEEQSSCTPHPARHELYRAQAERHDELCEYFEEATLE